MIKKTIDSFWETLPLGEGVKLLGWDANGLGALEKPAGTLSHPNKLPERARSLLTVEYHFERECYTWRDEASPKINYKLWLINRLDSATSGVILVCANELLSRTIKVSFNKCVHKTYVALCFGMPRLDREIWRDRLTTFRKSEQVRTNADGITPAEAEMRTLRRQTLAPTRSLIELRPRTGRTHQLRVQCSRRKLPIIGDQTYGDFRMNREFAKATGEKRLFLHSLETDVRYTWKGKACTFSAKSPQPKVFEQML